MKEQIILVVDNIHTRILGHYPHRAVDEATSFLMPGCWFTPAYKAKKWDGRIRLLNSRTSSFPTGLLGDVKKILTHEGCDSVVHDHRKHPASKIYSDSYFEDIKLRDYQIKAIEQGLKKLRGILDMASGSGKTEVAIGLTKVLGVKTLYLVHRLDLLKQTRERFHDRLGTETGQIGADIFEPGDITIAMVETLFARLRAARTREFLDSVGCIIADECHTVVAAQNWYKIFMACPAPYRYGLSATALARTDGRNMMLRAATGDVIFKMPAWRLIQLGYLAKPKIHFEIIRDRIDKRLGWQKAYVMGIKGSAIRNKAIIRWCQEFAEQGKTTLVLIRYIDHGKVLELAMRHMAGLRCTFIHGHPCDWQKRIRSLEEFKRGELDVLISSAILDEGIDMPDVDAVIIASGGNSPIKALQRVGRGLRKGKTGEVTVVDFGDAGHPILLKHSLARMQSYLDAGYEVDYAKEEKPC